MIKNWLEPQLAKKSTGPEEFSELLVRLLDYGVICRDESQVEQKLYDRFVQCEELIEDYFSLLNIRMDHNRRFLFVRVFPPGAEVPGLQDEHNQPYNGGMRARLNQIDVAMVLILRMEYAKQLREGRVDEKGCVLVSMEAITIAFNNVLKKSLPENLTERRALFRRLRQLRLVHYQQENDLDSTEGWLRIRPAITSFVTDEALDAIATREELQAYDDELREQTDQVKKTDSDNNSLFESGN